MTVHELITKKILKTYECQELKESKSNIKRLILKDVILILKRGINELLENIKDEKNVYSEIKKINSEIKISEKSIQIVNNEMKTINLDEYFKINENRNKMGVFCTIKLNGIKLEGFHSCE